MTQRELIKKLTQLKKVEPDWNWVIFCRKNLIANIADVPEPERITQGFGQAKTRFSAFLRQIMPSKAVLRPAAVLLIIFGFICGTGFVTLAKAKDSLPGDRFYPIKIALEQAKLFATTSADGKAELKGEIVASRLQELNKIMENQGSMDEKQQKMEEAVDGLQKQLLSIKDELSDLDKLEAKRAVEVAKKINADVAQAEQILSQAKAALPPEAKQTLTEKIAQAVDAVDKTSSKILGVIVEKQIETGEAVSQEEQAEIDARVKEKIESAKQRIETLEEMLNDSAIGNQFPENGDDSLMAGLMSKAKETLKQAEESLSNGDASEALQKITSTTEFIESAENLAKNLIIPSVEPDSASNSNATGTPSVAE